MDITLETIINTIQNTNPQLYVTNLHIPIKSVKFIVPDQSAFEPDLLYLGDLSQVKITHAKDTYINLLCYIEDKVPQSLLDYSKLNLMVVSCTSNLSTLFNMIQDVFIKQEIYRTGRSKLSELFLGGCDTQELIDCAFEVLHNPICLSDTTNAVMAYTKDISIEDQIWNEMIENKVLPERCFNTLKNKRIIEKIHVEKNMLITLLPYSKYRNILHNIVSDGKVLAQMGIVESMRTFEEEDFQFITFLGKIISAQLKKNNLSHNTKKIMFENFFTKLLEGKIADPETIEENGKLFHIQLDKESIVLTICIDEYEIDNTNLDYCRDQLEHILYSKNSIIYEDRIVFLLSNNLTANTIEKLKKFLKTNKLYAGFSRTIKDFKNLQMYYQQSLTAIEFGTRMNKKDSHFQYEDYAIYNLFKNFNTEELKDFCHPSIFSLLEYDHQNKTVFTETLYEYLNNSKNITNTSATLNIHRNSLNYRLEKIGEVMNTSLDNKKELFHVHLSLKILEFLGEVKHK